MSRIKAIVLDVATSRLRVAKVKLGKETKAGKVIFVDGAGAALLKKQVWFRPRWLRSDRRFVLMKEGDPRPLVLEDKLKPPEYDAAMFEAAIKSNLATRFMLGGSIDWRLAVMLLLGFVVVVLALALYSMGQGA